MGNTQDNEALGFYEPGFLHLHLHTQEDLSDLTALLVDANNRKLFSTFFHEYIHFLQEVTTPCGLMLSFLNIDYIKAVNWTVKNDGKAEFAVPISIGNAFNIKANSRLREIYFGDNKAYKYTKYLYYEVKDEAVTPRDGNTVRPKKYRVFFSDESYQRRSAHFGYVCIKEFITHTLQKKFFPQTEHPDFPYLIVEQIIAKEHPAFGHDPMMAVALCDACLMFTHPAQIFFTTLERMKMENFVPLSVAEVYEFTFHDVRFTGALGESLDFSNLYQYILSLCEAQFNDALKSEIFQDNRAWLVHVLKEAKSLRERRPHFITELVQSEGQLAPLFFEVVSKLGTPFFTNDKWEGKLIPPTGLETLSLQPYQLLVFKQIMRVYAGKDKCDLHPFCKTRSDRDITNENCLSAPWLRAKEEELCPFGQLWKTWGLTEEIPVKVY